MQCNTDEQIFLVTKLLANTDIFKDNIQYIFEPVNRNFSPEDLAFCKLFFPRNCFLNNLPLLIVVNNI